MPEMVAASFVLGDPAAVSVVCCGATATTAELDALNADRLLATLAVSLHRIAGASNIAACRHVGDTSIASYRYSHNGQINFAEAMAAAQV